MICSNCKREVPDTAKACGYCGHWLAAEDAGPTVEVPHETGATVALPEEKGRSPWLWIGLGLVGVILIAAIAALVLLPRGASEAEAPPTAAGAATQPAGAAGAPDSPAPVAVDASAAADTSAPADIPMYDDFNDHAFEGGYNQTQWRRDDVNIGHFVQEDGRLIIAQDGHPGQVALLASREYDRVTLSAPTAFEARMQLEPERPFGNTLMALAFDTVGGEGFWTECGIHPDWISCYADDFESDGLVPDRDLMHALRIEVDPATMEFVYYIDGRAVGAFVPPNADDLKGAEVTLFLGTTAHNNEPFAGFFDDVWVGPAGAVGPAAGPVAEAGEAGPVAEAVGAGPAMYDDFNDRDLDGDYNKGLWRRDGGSPGDFFQEDGTLLVIQNTEPDTATRLVAREYDSVRLEAPTAFEATFRLDPDMLNGNVQLALDVSISGGEDWWWTECALYAEWIDCYGDPGFNSEGLPVKPGTWHTVRIDVDPATATFTYYLDGRVEGVFEPPNAEALKTAEYAFKLGVWHGETGGGVAAQIDEVRVGRIE
jgi:hypothetical protein